jgi:micrococcal nuclease
MSCSTAHQKVKSSEANHQINGDCFHSANSFRCVKVVEVYDGDTIFIDLPDQHPLFGKRMGVRILGIDTPEIRTKNSCEKQKAQKAKKILQDVIEKATRVDIVDIKKDKFFRILEQC